ncbi:MAG: dihydroorotase, partial [FCB group bacterium]|nr:dihydroorotase [FCB group bacterium]
MIDPHVHLRDGKERHKETIEHGLRVAQKLGLSGVFDMPNTDPPILRRADVLGRLDLAKKAGGDVFYGLYCGLTADPEQVREAVACVRDLKEVVGLKLYAGSSTGDLSVPDTASRETIFQTLTNCDYRGVLAVHCEEESDFRP